MSVSIKVEGLMTDLVPPPIQVNGIVNGGAASSTAAATAKQEPSTSSVSSVSPSTVSSSSPSTVSSGISTAPANSTTATAVALNSEHTTKQKIGRFTVHRQVNSAASTNDLPGSTDSLHTVVTSNGGAVSSADAPDSQQMQMSKSNGSHHIHSNSAGVCENGVSAGASSSAVSSNGISNKQVNGHQHSGGNGNANPAAKVATNNFNANSGSGVCAGGLTANGGKSKSNESATTTDLVTTTSSSVGVVSSSNDNTTSNIQPKPTVSNTASTASVTPGNVKGNDHANSMPPLPPKVAVTQKGRFKLSTEMPIPQQSAVNVESSTPKDEVSNSSNLVKRSTSIQSDDAVEGNSVLKKTHTRVASVDISSTTQPEQNRRISVSSQKNQFSVSDRSMLTTGEGKIFNAGKLFYHLEQMKAEISEADKVNKAVASDSKLVRSINKDLEKKCRDLERRLQEEQALRIQAESKVKHLRKKLRELASASAIDGQNGDTVRSQDSLLSNNQTGDSVESQSTEHSSLRVLSANDNTNATGSCAPSGMHGVVSISDSLDQCFGENFSSAAQGNEYGLQKAPSPTPPRSRVHSASCSSENDSHKRSPVLKGTALVRSEQALRIHDGNSDDDNPPIKSRPSSRDFDPLYASTISDENGTPTPNFTTMKPSKSQISLNTQSQAQIPGTVPIQGTIMQTLNPTQQHLLQQQQSMSLNYPTLNSQNPMTLPVSQYSIPVNTQSQVFAQNQQYTAQQHKSFHHQDPFDAIAMRQSSLQTTHQTNTSMNNISSGAPI